MSFGGVTSYLTGGLINPSAPNYAGAASALNKKKQQQIDQGLQAINATYFGGSYPSYSQVGKGAKYDPSLSYATYNANKGYTPYAPQVSPVPGDAIKPGSVKGPRLGINKPKTAITNFKPGGGKLFQVTNSPYQTGFTPAFYQGVANDYIQAALPQLAQQQKSAQNAIQYGLFNKGLTPGSSAYADAMSNLNLTTGQAEQQVADNAVNAANSTQSQVMNAYQNAINQLYQTTNPAQAAQGAVSQAAGFKVPQTFTPIVNMFSNLANQYATNLLYNYTPTGGVSYAPTASGGGSGSGSGFLGPTANYGQ